MVTVPDTTPTLPPTDPEPPPVDSPRPAGFWLRALAKLTDLLVSIVLGFIRVVLMLIGMVLMLASCMVPTHATIEGHGASPEVLPENTVPKVEIARVRVHNVSGGLIEGSRNEGRTWDVLGHVLQPISTINPRGYPGSKYAADGTVGACANHVMHLVAGQNAAAGLGRVWSIEPVLPPGVTRAQVQSEPDVGATVATDIPAGTIMYGGAFTPFVGNPIFLDNAKSNALRSVPPDYTPSLGDVWVIRIERPRRYPREIVFENRFGGPTIIH